MKKKLYYGVWIVCGLLCIWSFFQMSFKTEQFLMMYEIKNNVSVNDESSKPKAQFFDDLDLSQFEGFEKQAKALHIALNDENVNQIEIDGFESEKEAKEFSLKFEELYGLQRDCCRKYLNNNYSIIYNEESFKYREKFYETISIINDQIENNIKQLNSRKEKIEAIIDYICDTYSYEKKQNKTLIALETGNANCVSYASTFKLMCNAVGIENDIVRGDAGGGHAWNRVKMDGIDYWYDICWEDSNREDISEKGQYVHSTELWESHTYASDKNEYKYS